MYLRLRLHVQIRQYFVLPYKAKISAQHGIGFILDRCNVYLGLTMPNLQKKRLLITLKFILKKEKTIQSINNHKITTTTTTTTKKKKKKKCVPLKGYVAS